MISNWAYILIGDNDTGKTTFQKHLLEILCGQSYDRLPRNIVRSITNARAPRKFETLFTANRSYQENSKEYGSVAGYFRKSFKDADVCILSSHSHGKSIDDVRQMIEALSARAYNVAGVFWSNNYGKDSQEISKLQWQERLWISNPFKKDPDVISSQIYNRASAFSEMLIEKSRFR